MRIKFKWVSLILFSIILLLCGSVNLTLQANASSFPEVQEQTIEGNQAITHMALKADDTKLSFICPSVINFAMKANGEFITPSAGQAYIENLSLMPLRMKSYTVTSDAAAKGMISTTSTTDDNAYEVKVKTQLSNPTPFAVTQLVLTSSEWSMTKAGDDTPKLDLTFSDGKMVNITNRWGSGAHLQDVVWNATADINNQVTVQFDSNGGSVIPDQIITVGGKVVEPEAPTRDHYKFGGWFIDSACTQQFNFEETTVNNYTLLFAKWDSAIEPYAVVRNLEEENETVTDGLLEFRYDEDRATYPADHTFDCLDTGTANPGWTKYTGKDSYDDSTVTTVNFTQEFCDNVKVKSCRSWFKGTDAEFNFNSKITTFNNIRNLDTSECTDFSFMFNFCTAITEAPDTSQWNTSNVTTIDAMFQNCLNMRTAPATNNWDTRNVTDMSWMFNKCWAMQGTPDTSGWITNKVTDMKNLFNECQSMTGTPVTSGWDTSNVTNMLRLFNSCSKIPTAPDTSNWNTEKVTDMSIMFQGCGLIVTPPNTSSWSTENVTNMSWMFTNCVMMRNAPDTSNWTNGKVTNMQCMFAGCQSMENAPDTSNWDMSNVTTTLHMFNTCTKMATTPNTSNWNTQKLVDMSTMFQGCEAMIDAPDTSNWDTSNVENMSWIFNNCVSMKSTPDTSKWNTGKATSFLRMFSYCKAMPHFPDTSSWDTKNVTDLSYMFVYCSEAEGGVNTSNWVTSKVTGGAYYMFYRCYKMTDAPDTSKWDTSQMTTLGSMFYDCHEMKEAPDTSGWNTSNVTDLSWMFSYCYLIQPPNVENWDVSKVTTLQGTFDNCTGFLTPPNVSKWDTKNVTNMANLFRNMPELTVAPDTSKWDTSQVTDMHRMFNHLYKVTEIDISNFTFRPDVIVGRSSGYVDEGMFSACSSLQRIYYDKDVSTIIKPENSYYMFRDSYSLPHYNSGVTDKTFAYPNNGQTGYFTPKHPVMKLSDFEGGYYTDEDGNPISQISGDYNATAKIKLIITDETKELDKIIDNAGKEYFIEDDSVPIELLYNGTITVTLKDKS